LDVQKIRQDFPVLQKDIDGRKIIYLDSACMSLRPTQVIDKINEYYVEYPSCAGRSVHKLATRVTIAISEARNKIQNLINAKNDNEIIFVRNTTEALNMVAQGWPLSVNDRVLSTDHEHNSNLVPWLFFQKQKNFTLEQVPSNPDNTFNLETFENMMDKNVKMVSMIHTANLDGHTNPAEEIVKIAHDYGAVVMLDGAQSAPHKPIDVQKMDVDFFAFSMHKMCGPSGIGILYGKEAMLQDLPPFIAGGSTVKNTSYDSMELLPPPEKFEAGLQNYAGIIGAGAAAEYLQNIGLSEIEQHNIKLNKKITNDLVGYNEIQLIGPPAPEERGNTFAFNIAGVDCHDVAMMLDETGNIMIRSGMQCVHSWFNHHNINGSARAAVYLYNTEKEMKIFSEKVIDIINNFKRAQ
jgi:cysteine desulfurase/selenocysteine lyase